MKGTKTKAGSTTTSKTQNSKGPVASSSGNRVTGKAGTALPYLSSNFYLGSNSREAFLKKLQLCMKTYDYKDETKDVRGKVLPPSLFLPFSAID